MRGHAMHPFAAFTCVLCCALLVATQAAADETAQVSQTSPPNDRIEAREFDELSVSVAVPSAEETIDIFGVDLYARNIQPVWIQIRNASNQDLYFTPRGVDSAYYTPFETGNRLPGGIARWLQSQHPVILDNHWPSLVVRAGETLTGYVYSKVDQGTKSFNVDVLGASEPFLMSFFIPVPGLKLDHYEVEFKSLYREDEVRDVDLDELTAYLQELPCCVKDKKGEESGDPLNIAFVGTVKDLYYTFLRAGWDETETIHGNALWKMLKSTLSGSEYRYSPVSALYVFGRPQDVALQKARTSIDERNHLRLWLTPVRLEGKPVWVGQISRDIGVHFTSKTITTHKIDPDVDETRDFLLEDLVYAQGVEKMGYVWGVGRADYDQPRGNLTGDPYFTDGRRLLMWLSGKPMSIDQLELVDLGAKLKIVR
jgi:hypothetical protein